ncbi:MAG: hypothetical protein L6408_00070 [Nanoarchaeota archaeon]|nr:hypothetical protein [Nanoarchaeota archaeon]
MPVIILKMKNITDIIDQLDNKLEDRYENTSLEKIQDMLYVHFKDNYDNSLAVYFDNKKNNLFCVTNFRNLNSEIFKSRIEWSETTDERNIDKLVDFFDECYKRMVQDNENFEQELRSSLPSDLDYDKIFVKPIPIGKRIVKE